MLNAICAPRQIIQNDCPKAVVVLTGVLEFGAIVALILSLTNLVPSLPFEPLAGAAGGLLLLDIVIVSIRRVRASKEEEAGPPYLYSVDGYRYQVLSQSEKARLELNFQPGNCCLYYEGKEGIERNIRLFFNGQAIDFINDPQQLNEARGILNKVQTGEHRYRWGGVSDPVKDDPQDAPWRIEIRELEEERLKRQKEANQEQPHD